MSELDKLVESAMASEGAEADSNKFYTVFFRSTLFMPAYQQDDADEPFSPMFLQDGDKYFISVFDSLARLTTWLADESQDVDYVEIDGSDLIRCIGSEEVYLCLNPSTDFYKEFSPEEIQRLKLMLLKIDKLKSSRNET